MNLVSNWRFRAWTLQTSSPGHPGDKSQRLHPLKVARNNTNFCFSLKVSSLVLLRYSLWTGPFVLNLWEATAWVYFLRTHLLTHSSNTPKCKQNKNKPGKFIRATLEWTVDNLFFNFRLVKVCLFLLSRVLLLGHGGEGSPWSFFFFFLDMSVPHFTQWLWILFPLLSHPTELLYCCVCLLLIPWRVFLISPTLSSLTNAVLAHIKQPFHAAE